MSAIEREGRPANVVPLQLRPVGLTEARKFVGFEHRHNLAPKFGLFSVGVESEGELVGVAIVGRPVARMLDDGWTAEVTRCCTVGTANACSMLYGACARAAKALGFRRLFTYTLASEPGASLKASGWRLDAELAPRKGWDTPSRPRVVMDLFGNERTPLEAKVRWVKDLAA